MIQFSPLSPPYRLKNGVVRKKLWFHLEHIFARDIDDSNDSNFCRNKNSEKNNRHLLEV